MHMVTSNKYSASGNIQERNNLCFLDNNWKTIPAQILLWEVNALAKPNSKTGPTFLWLSLRMCSSVLLQADNE